MKKTTKIDWRSIGNTILLNLGKLGTQRHLSALRDGFALTLPLLIAASVGIITMTFIFGGLDTVSTSVLGWIAWGIPGQVQTNANGIVQFVEGSVAQQISNLASAIFNTIWNGIFSFLALFTTMTIAFSLARIKGTKDTFIATLISLGAFMIFTYGDAKYFGTDGLLLAVLTAIISVEIFTWFEKNERLQVKMPAGVPPAVGRSFAKLFPTIFTLLIFIGFQAPFLIITALTTGFGPGAWFSIAKAISIGIQAPFLSLSDNTSGSFVIGFTFIFFSGLLWFFGLHGTNILAGIIFPLWVAGLARNNAFVASGIGSPTVISLGTSEAFITFGGTGVTLGLVLMGIFFARRKAEREVIKFSGASAVFNINEPLVFGIPLVLNFVYLVPYLLGQIVLFITTWLAIEVWRWVPPAIVQIPWTTPAIIGGFLATSSWQGIVLATVNLAIACLIWLPFIYLSNKQAKMRGEQLVAIDYRGTWKRLKERNKKQKKSPKKP